MDAHATSRPWPRSPGSRIECHIPNVSAWVGFPDNCRRGCTCCPGGIYDHYDPSRGELWIEKPNQGDANILPHIGDASRQETASHESTPKFGCLRAPRCLSRTAFPGGANGSVLWCKRESMPAHADSGSG